MKNKPETFICRQGVTPEREDCNSYWCPKMLPELNGLPWCDTTMKAVLSLTPTSIRVTTGEITCDARIGRVTVFVDSDNLITKIEQELAVPVDSDENGYLLRMRLGALRRGEPLPNPEDVPNCFDMTTGKAWREPGMDTTSYITFMKDDGKEPTRTDKSAFDYTPEEHRKLLGLVSDVKPMQRYTLTEICDADGKLREKRQSTNNDLQYVYCGRCAADTPHHRKERRPESVIFSSIWQCILCGNIRK